MAYTRKSYVGGAVSASISAALNAGATTVTITGTDTSWNGLGGASPNNTAFYLSIGYGTSTEEKVLVGPADYNWASGSVTVSITRGQDGTQDQYHASGTAIVPVMTAADLNEANYAVAETVGNISAIGDLLYGDGVNSLARLAAGTAGKVLTTNGAGVAPTWVDPMNVYSGSTSYTLSGYAYYLVVADVTLTQPATGMTAGAITLAAGGKTVVQSYPATANWVQYVTTSFVTSTSGTITATATKSSTGTLGTINLTVIGFN
jgi:hypothetical protein